MIFTSSPKLSSFPFHRPLLKVTNIFPHLLSVREDRGWEGSRVQCSLYVPPSVSCVTSCSFCNWLQPIYPCPQLLVSSVNPFLYPCMKSKVNHGISTAENEKRKYIQCKSCVRFQPIVQGDQDSSK